MDIVLDTNILIDNPEILEELINEGHQIYIPYIVLKELDNLKRDRDIGYLVRYAIRELLRLSDSIKFETVNSSPEQKDISNDEKIILSAKNRNAVIYTNDIHMYILSKSYGVNCELRKESVLKDHYEPYHYIGTEELANTGFTFQNSYDIDNIQNILASLGIDNTDQWKFFIVEKELGKIDYVYVLNPIKRTLERIDNKSKYKEIKTDYFKIKALDIYQNIAIYALKEAPNILITGKWGSGKNILSVSYSLSIAKDRKIFITRPNVGINSKFDIGYLPGDKNDKLIEWSAGFLSALYFIYGNTKGQKQGNVSYDYVKETIFPEKFEIIPLNMIQGLSLLEDDIMIVDEIQLISTDYMSMLLSRFSKGSKLIMLGDYKQTYNVVSSSDSGLLSLIKVLPHKELCWVKLKNTFRSGLTELADNLKNRLDI